MTDNFQYTADTPSQPARNAFAITPHATNEIDPLPKAVFVGTGGNITGRPVGASADVVFKNLANGQILDVRFQYIRATGTTATDLVGLA